MLPANGMKSEFVTRAKMPCSNCYITAMQANIKYTDGREANIDTGAWLHHMVSSMGIKPIFASGNERTPLVLDNDMKYGLDVGPTDRISMMIDLMSASSENKNLLLTMTYDYVPKMGAVAYKPVFMVSRV